MLRKFNVSYGRTMSRNYQGQRADFGMDVVVEDGEIMSGVVADARQFCQIMVNDQLGLKIGLKRSEANRLSRRFMGCSWDEARTGVAKEDEEL